MLEPDPTATQRDLQVGLVAELAAAGFYDAREIGRGGFGYVYRCVEASLDRAVAIKVLTSDLAGEDRDRFIREQHALGRLSGHPNIVQILQADITATGRPYIVMPFHSRGSLAQRLRTRGPVPWPEVLSIGERIAGALAAAHAAGTVHRDVKPANILVTDFDEPQLADFGIAHIGGGFETTSRHITGTPAFIAPEVLSGAQPSPASDLYSLGATLFCLLTGHAAYERRSGESVVAQFLRMTTEPIPDLRDTAIPCGAIAVVEAAMALDPQDRPETAADYQRQLREALRSCGSVTELGPSGVNGVVEFPPHVPRAGSRHLSAPPAAVTKFRPPTVPRASVDRPRLLQMLRAGRQRRLAVIHAPAGFGKSTLATQWAQALISEQVQVAWLNIDADDNNAVWLLAHLIEAIRRARPGLGNELEQILEERATDATRYVISTLINEIHSSGDTFVVVVDDWQRVTSSAARAAMNYLLDNACHHLRIIVTCRTPAGLPLAQLRVRDELVEIDSEDLRFDAAEADAFLLDATQLPLTPEDVVAVRESTGGWAAALQLTSLSLRGKDRPSEHIGRLSGHSYALGEYVTSAVLDALDPTLVEFLLATSVTETVCGDLANALAEVACGQEMLEEAEHLELFLRRIDDSEWFRYQRLFADLLRHRLAGQDPDRLRRLHRTASRWFADHQMLNEAVDHALTSDDIDGAVEIVERHGLELLERSKMASVLGLVAKLPPAHATSNLRLQLLVAWANIGLQRLLPARTALNLVDAMLVSGVPNESETDDLHTEVAVIRTLAGYFADEYSDLPEIIERRLRDDGGERGSLDPFFASTVAGVASLCALYSFDFAAARRWQRWAAPYHPRQKGPFTVAYGYCLSAIASYEELDIGAAESDLRTALALAQTAGTHSHGARLAATLLGALLYERGDIATAEALLDDGVEFGPETALVEFMIAGYGIGARVQAVRGAVDAAETRLAAGAKIAEDLALPRLAARITNERVRLGLPVDDQCQDVLRHLPIHHRAPNGLLALTAELQQDTVIRLLLADHTAAAAEEACTRAEYLVREIATADRPRALTSAELLWAASLVAAGRLEEARNVAAPAITRCAEQGLVRFVADERGLRPILVALAADPETAPGLPLSFVRQALAQQDLSP